MSEIAERLFRKLGANRKELARRQPRRDRNFSQSRDIWEDRGERQTQTGARNRWRGSKRGTAFPSFAAHCRPHGHEGTLRKLFPEQKLRLSDYAE